MAGKDKVSWNFRKFWFRSRNNKTEKQKKKKKSPITLEAEGEMMIQIARRYEEIAKIDTFVSER